MKNDTVISAEGMEALLEKLGLIEAERFITLIKNDKFDYTRWRQNQFEGKSIKEISAEAMARRIRMEKAEKAKAASSPRKAKVAKSTKTSAPRRRASKRLVHA